MQCYPYADGRKRHRFGSLLGRERFQFITSGSQVCFYDSILGRAPGVIKIGSKYRMIIAEAMFLDKAIPLSLLRLLGRRVHGQYKEEVKFREVITLPASILKPVQMEVRLLAQVQAALMP